MSFHHAATRHFLIVLGAFLLLSSTAFATVYRVKADATASYPDGQSWATAYREIQAAVDKSVNGDEVWVAKGTYLSAYGYGPIIAMKTGVNIYGGFVGTESARSHRDWLANPTILNGMNDRYCVKGVGNAVLDGFTVTRGNAGSYGGGMYEGVAANCIFDANTAYDGGAGMYNGIATNCAFTGNAATHNSSFGGGMYGGTAVNCTFTANSAYSDGGGMYEGTAVNCTFAANAALSYGGGMSEGTATNCTFIANTASCYGGGMSGGTATNCVFAGNDSQWGGGGMLGGTVINCTFANNSSQRGGGMEFGAATNCIFWGNGPNEISGTNVTYSCLGSTTTGTGNITGNPRFVNSLSGDYRLRADSPCIDAGTSTGAPIKDRLDRVRPQGAGIDMGAFEHFPGDDSGAIEPLTILRVNVASTAASPDGLSWETAYPTLQGAAGQVANGAEIWVAKGVYTASTGTEVLRLNPGTAVYGGFVGTESTRAERETDNAATVIDGGGVRRCIMANGGALADGFTIRNGKADSGGGMYGGIAMNCTFAANTASSASGGGLCCGMAADCTFYANAAVSGGGMYCGSAVNCTFNANSASSGGGMYLGTATNCTLTANTASSGGGMWAGTATNCIFHGNSLDEANGTNVSYSFLDSATTGIGNIVGSPQFVNPLSGDYRLRAESPCIDMGTSNGAPTIDGLARPRPNGAGVDMGAFEYYSGDDTGALDPPAVLRVNAASTAVSPDGLTWETAYSTLQGAADHAGYGTEIWVAKGLYTTTLGAEVLRLNPDTFAYGGFAGTETSRVARGTDISATVIDGGRTRRCITANATSVVDGLTIKNGYGSGNCGGMFGGTAINCAFSSNTAYSGGGLYYGTAEKCTFLSNTAFGYAGGGMFGGTATDCDFTTNSAAYCGGGMDNGTAIHCTFNANSGRAYSGGGMTNGTATNCTFAKNTAVWGGGISYSTATDCTFTENSANGQNSNDGGGGMFSGTATNCTFSKNSAVSYGGGMRDGTVTNCTFTGNLAGSSGGGIYNGTATNCTFARNSAASVGGMCNGAAVNCIFSANGPNEVVGCSVSYSCLGFETVGEGNFIGNPRFVNSTSGDYRLRADSPCIDTGTASGSPATDQLGRPRPRGTGVDMGAFEYYPGDDAGAIDSSAVLRVNAESVAPSPDGLTWETAFPTLQGAADQADYGTEIWVARGVYAVATGAQVLQLNSGTTVYGGFLGTETIRAERHVEIAAAVIDGGKSRRCIMADTGSAVDGFTVTNGNGSPGGGMYGGTAANCVFAGNTAGSSHGGGMCGGVAVNCIFTGNTAQYGAGVSYSKATNCTFTANTTTLQYSVGGMFQGTATNCVLWGDTASNGIEIDATSIATYSCVQGGYSGVGNINADPQFFDAAHGDLRLISTSACIDAGTADGAPTADIRGVTRPQGAGIDMGAYEFAPGDPTPVEVTYSVNMPDGGTVTGPPTMITGTTAALTVLARAGYVYTSATATNGTIAGAPPNLTLSNVTGDTTVMVTFAPRENAAGYATIPSAGGTLTGPATITTGTAAALTAFASAGHLYTSASATNGALTGSLPNLTLSGVTADTLVTLTFTPMENTATYVAAPAAFGTLTGPSTITTGTTAELTVTASEGYILASATATNGTISGHPPNLHLSNVTGNTMVTATFAPRDNAVAYAANPAAGGTVTGPSTIATGTSAVFTPLANAGYLYASAAVTNGTVNGTPPNLTLSNVTADTTVTVTFTPKTNNVAYTANPVEGGTVTGPPTIVTGTAAGLTASANAGYSINGVTASNGSVTPSAPYVLSGVTDNTTVTAVFVHLPVAVPNVVGQTQTAASAAITGAGLALGAIAQACSAMVQSGSVVSQIPAAGQQTVFASAVDLVISTGACSVTVPSLAGQTREAADATLVDANLVAGTVTRQCSDSAAAGLVISQNPAAGAQVDPESSVALVLSTGPCAAEGEGEGENTPPTEAQLRELLTAAFDTVDVDNDGQVSFAEALTALAGLTQEVFNSVDTDGNGQISRAEAGLNEGGCAGCRGGKADFMPDRMKKLFSGAFLGMLSLIAMVSFERRRR